jgi:starch synthase
MNILFVAVEMTPVAKVGGLADVIGALPKALIKLGHNVRVVLPRYRMIETTPGLEIREIAEFSVAIGPHWTKPGTLAETVVDGVPVWLVGTDEWYDKSVDSSSLYQPGGDMHLFFSRAVLQAAEVADWIPDVIHCHDWHTGFIPVLMREQASAVWDEVAAVFTIHNFAYQGEFGLEVLDRLGLCRSLFNANQLEAFGSVNFLKAGCVFSDRVNTVSETYAEEIQTPEFGCSLDGLMRHLADMKLLRGILNGIDQDVFNPETDTSIPFCYNAANIRVKAQCKAALLREIGLPDTGEPLFGIVSRLSGQKGLDLVAECAPIFEELGAQIVIQGLGDPWLASEFLRLQAKYPERIRLVQEFNAPLAQRVYAGSDVFLMPSRFEPCGLGQLIAMRYGTIPVVRATGGLKDTVEDGVTGFSFGRPIAAELGTALERAVKAYGDRDGWSMMIQTAMSRDFGWDASALRYEGLYEQCLAGRMMQIA